MSYLIDYHNMCVTTQNKIITSHKNETNYKEQQRKAWKSKDNETCHKDQKKTLFSVGGWKGHKAKKGHQSIVSMTEANV